MNGIEWLIYTFDNFGDQWNPLFKGVQNAKMSVTWHTFYDWKKAYHPNIICEIFFSLALKKGRFDDPFCSSILNGAKFLHFRSDILKTYFWRPVRFAEQLSNLNEPMNSAEYILQWICKCVDICRNSLFLKSICSNFCM